MRKLLYVLASASLWWPATAAAEDFSPTPAELQNAHAVALDYWGVQPSCGRERVVTAPLVGYGAWADYGACTITFSVGTGENWRDFPIQLCRAYVHEFGHLVLGPLHFAAINPTEPDHSPDPANVMYGKPVSVAQEEVQARSVGCLPASPTHHHAARSRSRLSRRG